MTTMVAEMNKDYRRIIAASLADRRDLFLMASNRLGVPIQNIEKDFWVCWVLDLLFNERHKNEPRLLFNGGTSLSKAYSLISRFSEDLDITVFREDLGEHITPAALEELSGKQQRIQLEKIKQACQSYIQGDLKKRLNQKMESVFHEMSAPFTEPPVIIDLDDPSQQTLLIRYPSVNNDTHNYIKPMVKIEAGAKSAFDPHQLAKIQPYIATDLPTFNLITSNVVTINPERTFWDKVIILHGLRRWFDRRGQLRQQGHRISRHYYDLYKLINSPIGQRAIIDSSLALECARHAKLFFNSTDLDLKTANPGSFSIVPTSQMQTVLKQDYKAMTGMIFGEIPSFLDIVKTIEELELSINQIK